MKLIEIIPIGDYNAWDESKLNELKKEKFSEIIGEFLFENEEIKLSEIVLNPKERIPFRSHKNNYSYTSFTDGLLLTRNRNGQVGLIRLVKGGIIFCECSNQESIKDLENVGEETIRLTVVEQKLSRTSQTED